MRENKVRNVWKSGGVVVNGWLGIPSSVSAEIMAQQGWDSITLDIQHGLLDYSSALPMLQAISTTQTTPMARVSWCDPTAIQKLLDAGAYGIICPMINNRADAEALVNSCKYPPIGERSYAGARNMIYAGADYTTDGANATVLAIAMIETVESVEKLDEILDTPGLDGIYVGPSDLGLTFGYTAQPDQTDPKVVAIIEGILAKAKAKGVPAGIHCLMPDYAARMVKLGFQLVTVGADMRFLTVGAKQAVTETWEAISSDSDMTSPGSNPH